MARSNERAIIFFGAERFGAGVSAPVSRRGCGFGLRGPELGVGQLELELRLVVQSIAPSDRLSFGTRTFFDV